jgi:hypothetical protein
MSEREPTDDLDHLRWAMRATERPDGDPLDLTTIMRAGRRLRLRRRLAGGGAALATVLLVVGAGIGVREAREPGPQEPPAPAATTPAARPTVAAYTPSPSPWAEERRPPVGDVVDSGIRYGTEQRVFYVVAVDLPDLPKVRIGLAAGRRAPGGEPVVDFLVNDVRGSDRRPGFHEIGYDASGPDRDSPPVPTFGYFVGPAERIVGTVGGREVTARLARWSEDGQVVVFWFDPADLTPGVRLDGIVAHDARGQRL